MVKVLNHLLVFVICILLMPILVTASNWSLKWETNYGGSDYEWFNTLNYSYDKDGNVDGYIVTGESYSTDLKGFENPERLSTGLLVKYDFNGKIVWQVATDFKHENSWVYDFIYSYDEDNKVNGYTIVYLYNAKDQVYINVDRHAVVANYDLDGKEISLVDFSGIIDSNISVIQYFEDGVQRGYYVSRRYRDVSEEYISGSDFFYTDISLYDMNLNFVENKYLNSGKYHGYYLQRLAAAKTEDGIKYVAEDEISGEKDCLVQYDSDLNVEWEYCFGTDYMSTMSGYIYMSYDKFGYVDGYIVFSSGYGILNKFDLNGNKLWTYEFDDKNVGDYVMMTYNAQGDPDGYLVSGDKMGAENKDTKAYIAKISYDGHKEWDSVYGGTEAYDGVYNRTGNDRHSLMSYDENGNYDGYYVLITDSGSTSIPGIEQDTNGNAIFLKYDFDGNILWQYSYGGNEEWDVGSNLIYSYNLNGAKDGVIFLMSDVYSSFGTIKNNGESDPVLVKFAYDFVDFDVNGFINNKNSAYITGREQLTYKVNLANNSNVSVKDNLLVTKLPDYVTVVESSITGNGKYDKEHNEIIWELDELEFGQLISYQFDFLVEEELKNPITIYSELSNEYIESQKSNDVTIYSVKNPNTSVMISIIIIGIFVVSYLYNLLVIKKVKNI